MGANMSKRQNDLFPNRLATRTEQHRDTNPRPYRQLGMKQTFVQVVVVTSEQLELEEDGVAVVEVGQRVAAPRLCRVRQVEQEELAGQQRYG